MVLNKDFGKEKPLEGGEACTSKEKENHLYQELDNVMSIDPKHEKRHETYY